MGERNTINVILAMLAETKGGAIVVMCHGQPAKRLRFDVLDNGAMRDVLAEHCRNVHEPGAQAKFCAIMRAFRKHTESDRWEDWLLEQLAQELGEDKDPLPSELRNLNGQPKDGALLMSSHGNVVGAAASLQHQGSHTLRKINGRGAGTRHAAGLAVTEFLGHLWNTEDCLRSPGFVLVTSDAGGMCVMLPNKVGPPTVLQVPHSRGQLEVIRELPQTPRSNTYSTYSSAANEDSESEFLVEGLDELLVAAQLSSPHRKTARRWAKKKGVVVLQEVLDHLEMFSDNLGLSIIEQKRLRKICSSREREAEMSELFPGPTDLFPGPPPASPQSTPDIGTLASTGFCSVSWSQPPGAADFAEPVSVAEAESATRF